MFQNPVKDEMKMTERLRLLAYLLYSTVHRSQSRSSNIQAGTELPSMGQPEFLGEGRSEAATIYHSSPSHHHPQNYLFTITTRRYCFFINPAVLAELEKDFGKLCVVTVPSGDSPVQVGEALPSGAPAALSLFRIT